MSKSRAMAYGDTLPPVDADIHLQPSDFRTLEKQLGFDTLFREGMTVDTPANGIKAAKASFEVSMMKIVGSRLKKMNVDHPPYGLIVPSTYNIRLVQPEPQAVPKHFISEDDTKNMLQRSPLKVAHALSDLKTQAVVNDLFLESASSPAFNDLVPLGNLNAKNISGHPMATWKLSVQSAASNAKRSEFIVLKQIIVQCLREMDTLPSRTEFLAIAHQSTGLLQMLASTHQEIFKTLNTRLIQDEQKGEFHRLVSKDGMPRLVLNKNILDGLDYQQQPSTIRTMCVALLATDENGVSLLEQSYHESAAMVADMIYKNEEPIKDRFEEIAKETLPKSSVHMFLKLVALQD